MRRRAVPDAHVRAGPHGRGRRVAVVERREPDGLRLPPPYGVSVVHVAEVLLGHGVVHGAGEDAVGLDVQARHLEKCKNQGGHSVDFARTATIDTENIGEGSSPGCSGWERSW